MSIRKITGTNAVLYDTSPKTPWRQACLYLIFKPLFYTKNTETLDATSFPFSHSSTNPPCNCPQVRHIFVHKKNNGIYGTGNENTTARTKATVKALWLAVGAILPQKTLGLKSARAHNSNN